MNVYVQDKNGNSLDPTTPARARKLLNNERAEVVERSPFKIRILDRKREESYTQDVTLGIDTGYSRVGFSAISEDEELISGELKLRQDIPKKLEQRRNYRRTRRHRNTRYRPPRFDNRKKEEGWLTPSIRHKLHSHIKLIKKIKGLLPITKVIVEVAKFDTQKMQNPEIEDVEYQQGELQGYEVKEYLLEKFGNECVYCGITDVPLETEHIIPKSREGSDRVSNLTIACIKCNQDKGNQTAEEYGHPEVQKQAKEPLKATAFMNQIRWRIVNKLDCDWTYGYKTKYKRSKLGLDKSHVNDAFVIANGSEQSRTIPYKVEDLRCNNRKLEFNRKTYGRSIRTQHYKFQPKDIVRYLGQIFSVRGTHCKGARVLLENGKSVAKKAVELIKYKNNWQLLPALKDGASVA